MDDLRAFLSDAIAGGFGVREIARQSGLASSTISRIVNTDISPNIITANKILKPFGYKIAINKIGMKPVE